MERYAPTLKDLAPRDMVARAMYHEIKRGPRYGPNKDYVHLDSPPGAEVTSKPSCPTSPSSPASIWAWSRYTEPVPIYPPRTTRWAAFRPTSTARCCATTPMPCPACSRPANAPASRCTAPTGWAPTRLLDIVVFGRRAAWPSPSTPQRPTSPRCRKPGASSVVSHAHRAGGERVATCGRSCRTTMDPNAEVFRTEETLKQALDVTDGSRSATRRCRSHDKGKRFNTDLLEAVELGFLLDLAEVTSSARWPARNAAAATTVRTTRTRRRQLDAAHHGVPGRYGRRSGPKFNDEVSLDFKPVTIPVTSRRNANTDDRHVARVESWAGRAPQAGAVPAVTSPCTIQRFNPETDTEPHWETYKVSSSRPTACSKPCTNQVGPGRHADVSAVLRARRVWVGRDADQRPQSLACKVLVKDDRDKRSPSNRSGVFPS